MTTPLATTPGADGGRGRRPWLSRSGCARRPAAVLWPAILWMVMMVMMVMALACGAGEPTSDTDGDLARKADIMHGDRWQRTIAEFGGWLATQTILAPAEVLRIKAQFNDRVAGMSSYELEYLLDSVSTKLELLGTAEARDAKAWLGEYLAAMSDARRSEELRRIPNLLDMNATQLREQIQRIDRMRATLQQRQQGFEARQGVLAERATAGHQATAKASQTAAARARSAPAHSPYRQGGGSAPFSDVQRRPPLIGIGMFGGFIPF